MKRKHRRRREMEAHADLILKVGELIDRLHLKVKGFVTRRLKR